MTVINKLLIWLGMESVQSAAPPRPSPLAASSAVTGGWIASTAGILRILIPAGRQAGGHFLKDVSKGVGGMMQSKYIILAILGLFLLSGVASAAVATSQFGALSDRSLLPIGGGKGYSNIYHSGNVHITNTSTNAAQLIAALHVAKPGNVIFIPETANINMTGIYGTEVPAGVTIAGDRGYAGSPGGRIFRVRLPNDPPITSMASESMLIVYGGNVRITGLRIDGGWYNSTTVDYYSTTNGIVLANGYDLTVDNNEIYGWTLAGVLSDVWNTTTVNRAKTGKELGKAAANIHHNYFHNNLQGEEGYGVSGTALIKANVFDFNRHAIAGSGGENEVYEASYNMFLGNNSDSFIDVHGTKLGNAIIAGYTQRIHHNTFNGHVDGGHLYTSFQFSVRGVPLVPSQVYKNSFKNTTYFTYSQNSPPVVQWGFGGYGNVSVYQNLVEGKYVAADAPYHCPVKNMYDYSCGW